MAAGVAADLLVHVGADIKDAVSGLNQVGSATDNAGKNWAKTSLMFAGGAAAVVGGLGMAINAAADYEQSISNITALGGEYAKSQEQISSLALKIGQDTAFSATEGAQAIAELAKAGVSVTDILGGAAMEAANLAQAGGQSIPEAANTMANAMNMFGIAGKDAQQVADSFAAAANASAADVGQLAQALAQGGPASALLGNSLQETNAVLALFSNYGIKGSDAGTSLKTMLQSLTNPSTEAAAKMKELGINAFDASGNFVGFSDLAGQLQKSLGGLTKEQQSAALAMIFGSDASRVAAVLMTEGAAGVDKMTKAVSEQGVAGEMAKAKMDNLNGAIEQLKGSFETLLIVVGSQFIPIIRGAADGITGVLNKFLKLPKPAQKLFGLLAVGAAAFLGLGAAISGVIAFAPALIAMFTAMLGPVALVVAAIVGLVYIFETDFLGIRTAIEAVMGAFQPFIEKAKYWADAFGQVFDRGIKVRDMLIYFPGPIREVAHGFLLIADALGDMYHAFESGGLKGLMDAMPKGLDQIKQGLLILANEGFKAFISAVSSIDWGAVGSAIWNGLLAAIEVIGSIAGPIIEKLGDLSVSLGKWLWDEASSVQWGTILANAAGAAGDITGRVVSKLGDLTARLSNWLGTQAGKVDWSGILSSAASKAGNIVSSIIDGLGDLLGGLKRWYDNAIQNVPWHDLGRVAGEKVGSLVRTLAPKMAELISGAITYLQEHWIDIAKAIGTLIIAMPATIGYIGYTFLPKAAELIAGFIEGLGINWGLVGNWLKENFWKIPLLTPYLAYLLAPKAWELLKGLVDALPAAWEAVKGWLSTIGDKAIAAVGVLSATLKQAGIDLLVGFIVGLIEYWQVVKAWLGTIDDLAIVAVGTLIGTLKQAGKDLIQGIADGAGEQWDTVIVPAFQAMPGTFQGYFYGAWGWLAQAGRDIVQGLINGIGDMIGALQDKVNELIGILLLPTKLGHSPWPIMIDAGKDAIDGLIIGWQSRINDLRGAIVATAGAMPEYAAATPPAASSRLPMAGTTVQNFDISLRLQDLEELVEAGRFATQLNGTRTLYKGQVAGSMA